jgi:hypothetical protein
MNLFVVFKRPDGKTEVVTPPLDGMILPGVTRDSVLSIAREHAAGTYKLKDLPDSLVITERPVTMKEVQKASKDGSLLELFGAGAFCTFYLIAFILDAHTLCSQAPLLLLRPLRGLVTLERMFIFPQVQMAWAPFPRLSGRNSSVVKPARFLMNGV